jgi:hypothetical protein
MEPYGEDSAGRSEPGAGPESPVADLAEVAAWKARKRYPSTLLAGGPVFGVARERAEGEWVVEAYFAGLAPQDARDSLGAHFRQLAAAAGANGRAEYAKAAERLDGEGTDELTVGGSRYRVVRADRFIRMGPDGPEPPRATDPDPEPDPGWTGGPVAAADPAAGMVIAPAGSGGEGVLYAELLAAVRKNGAAPRGVRDDSRRAARTHPDGVLLPATFMTAEREDGRWRPHSTGTAAIPRDARNGLAMHLRVLVPWQNDLTPEEHEVYKRAADHLDAEQLDEVDVAGRHFRIVRVERLVRVGPDGPEGPRPSDLDALEPEPEPEPAAEADSRTQRFRDLFEAENRRRAALNDRADP